ncbi:hypothetical protein EDM68_03765 [Candidatus Uhrbacteria bacterium]|nr:MAG: hypothetical protein EDM68_03765 [Candidatus Uhrbacteria bacterium]
MKHFLPALAIIGACFALPVATRAAELEPGQFVRSSDGTVYWFAENERRYVFPDGATLQSWLGGTPGMLNDASDVDLEQYPVGGPMTMRPGSRLVRFASDPTVYVVTRGAVLRAATPELASAFYGSEWLLNVETLSVALFSNYRVGAPLVYTSDFDRSAELAAASMPERDLELRRANGLLPSSTAPLKADVKTTVDPIVVHPPEQPTIVSFRVTVSKPNTDIANLRTDIFRENGPWIKACRGIDLCVQDIDYQLITKDIEDRFYAIVSNDRGETLPRAYSPLITVRPIRQTLAAQ